MALAAEASRRFASKLNNLLDKNVVIKLNNGSLYKGKLSGIDVNTLSIALEEVTDSNNNKWPLVILYGGSITEILVEEESIFNAREFAEYLARYGGIGWHLMKVYDDINVLEVAKTIRVSKDGVEGAGPMAQKIHTLYVEYLRTKGASR
ncbi:MAG: Lsm family RNA-binding protein [Desulfurococcales archaeon]|nr:Lsm family RNA-binding protein [Desulfurococcales archaeon]MEB3780602.1 Lsm family RNA-binding protein [Desulfurococcales archaeon]